MVRGTRGELLNGERMNNWHITYNSGLHEKIVAVGLRYLSSNEARTCFKDMALGADVSVLRHVRSLKTHDTVERGCVT